MPEQVSLLPVVTAIDDNYVYPLLVSMFSGSESLAQAHHWRVAHDPRLLSASSRELIGSAANVFGVDVEFQELAVHDKFPDNGHITATAFARLPLADSLDDFAWIDVDTLLLPGWGDLLNAQEFSRLEVVAQAHSEGVAPGWQRQPIRNRAYEVAGSRYFNSGVMRMSGARWRSLGFDKRWPEVVERYGDFGFYWSDQCVLNYLIAGTNADLGHEFNLHPSSALPVGVLPRILHFHGFEKPWRYTASGSRFNSGPAQPRWQQYWDCESRMMQALHTGHPDIAGEVAALRLRLTVGPMRQRTIARKFVERIAGGVRSRMGIGAP